jgi:hypothetical protein
LGHRHDLFACQNLLLAEVKSAPAAGKVYVVKTIEVVAVHQHGAGLRDQSYRSPSLHNLADPDGVAIGSNIHLC